MTSQTFSRVLLTAFIGMMALVAAFRQSSQLTRTKARLFAGVGEGVASSRINKAIELGSPKVVHNIELKPGEKCAVCRCWLSKKFPLCDGAHNAHNIATGDNIAPAIVTVPK